MSALPTNRRFSHQSKKNDPAMQLTFDSKKPIIHPSCFVAPSADIVGDVLLEEQSTIWFGAVLRGDNEKITVGKGSNIQDGAVIHVDPGKPCRVGENCVVGHRAVLHGCTLHNQCLVGIGAIILNDAVVGENCLVGAGALVTEGKILEPGHLYMGVPAKKIRALSQEEKDGILKNALGYQARGERYRE